MIAPDATPPFGAFFTALVIVAAVVAVLLLTAGVFALHDRHTRRKEPQ